LAAGHSVDTVVYKDDGDGFSAIGGMHDLGGADRGQVAIALVTDHDAVRPAALDGARHSRRTPVSDLNVADIEVVIREDGAAHGTNEDGPVLYAKRIDRLRQQFVNDAVSTPGTVMSLVLQLRLTFVQVVEAIGFFVRDGVTRHGPAPPPPAARSGACRTSAA